MALVNFQISYKRPNGPSCKEPNLSNLHGEFEDMMEVVIVNLGDNQLAQLGMKHAISRNWQLVPASFVLFQYGRPVHRTGNIDHDQLRNCINSFARR